MCMKCDAIIRFADDYGDNVATFTCQLEKGHTGLHLERGDMGSMDNLIPYVLSWSGSDVEEEDDMEDEWVIYDYDANNPSMTTNTYSNNTYANLTHANLTPDTEDK